MFVNCNMRCKFYTMRLLKISLTLQKIDKVILFCNFECHWIWTDQLKNNYFFASCTVFVNKFVFNPYLIWNVKQTKPTLIKGCDIIRKIYYCFSQGIRIMHCEHWPFFKGTFETEWKWMKVKWKKTIVRYLLYLTKITLLSSFAFCITNGCVID